MLKLSAYAKINLTLEVLGRRDDGYHEITSVLQTIDLADVISFELADELRFVCRDTSRIRVDLLKRSILKTANLLRAETGCNDGALINMESVGIPRAAGLGSSSTDSAAVLKGLNEIWSLRLSTNDLSLLAAKLGSDTPFFIRGGTALAEGRGEKITPLPSPGQFRLILLLPDIPPITDKTARMYAMLAPSDFTNGSLTDALVVTLLSGSHLSFSSFFNIFERVAFDFFPKLDEFRLKLLESGLRKVHLAGAGPTLFALPLDTEQGKTLAESLKKRGIEAHLTHIL